MTRALAIVALMALVGIGLGAAPYSGSDAPVTSGGIPDVGPVSWPTALVVSAYLIRGWSPTVTVKLDNHKAE